MESDLIHIESAEIESLSEIGVGKNELVLRFTEGLYKGRFIYVKTDPEGEKIGSGDPDEFGTTTYIENAELSDIHSLIIFNEEYAEYHLKNASIHNTGTWIKILPNMLTGNHVFDGTLLKIGRDFFAFSEGKIVFLEDLIEEILPQEFWHFFTDLDNFTAIDVKSFSMATEKREKLQRLISKISAFPKQIKSLMVESEKISQMLHYKSVKIGSTADSEVCIDYPSDIGVKLKYIHPYYTLVLKENTPVYRKLNEDEDFVLYPGNVFRIGNVEFMASRFNVGRWSHIGKRSSMEDTDLVCHNLFLYEDLAVTFYSIYDGHGGIQCSQFLQKTLHEELRLNFLASPSRFTDVINSLKSTIFQTFQAVDSQFSQCFPETCASIGSAAVICMIIGDRILTVNLGDSRAVLSRGGIAIELSVDHKPDQEKEYERIVSNGGKVMLGRIDSKLSISRAFGDFEFKSREKGNLVSIQPDITQIFIDPVKDEFIVIGCDGLFEAYSSQEIVNCVRERLASMPVTEQDPNRVIRELVNEAIFENKTSDNVTALLICLNSGIVLD